MDENDDEMWRKRCIQEHGVYYEICVGNIIGLNRRNFTRYFVLERRRNSVSEWPEESNGLEDNDKLTQHGAFDAFDISIDFLSCGLTRLDVRNSLEKSKSYEVLVEKTNIA